jgi:DNA invertase Pin-like site-specific DNA recombinase
MVLGYARVSKGEEQDTRMQETALRAAGVERLRTERTSGGRWDRPALHRLLNQLRPGDVVAVWIVLSMWTAHQTWSSGCKYLHKNIFISYP